MTVASCKLLTSPCLLLLPLPGFSLCACFSATGTLYIFPCLPAPLGSRELREGGLWLPLGGIRQGSCTAVSGKVILAVDVWITELAVRDFYRAFFPGTGRPQLWAKGQSYTYPGKQHQEQAHQESAKCTPPTGSVPTDD